MFFSIASFPANQRPVIGGAGPRAQSVVCALVRTIHPSCRFSRSCVFDGPRTRHQTWSASRGVSYTGVCRQKISASSLTLRVQVPNNCILAQHTCTTIPRTKTPNAKVRCTRTLRLMRTFIFSLNSASIPGVFRNPKVCLGPPFRLPGVLYEP